MDFTIDFSSILKIVGIDIMLGVDNAVVIALACASLPAALRSRAVIYGTAGAVILRAVLLVFASFLMDLTAVKLVAGAYLLWTRWGTSAPGSASASATCCPV